MALLGTLQNQWPGGETSGDRVEIISGIFRRNREALQCEMKFKMFLRLRALLLGVAKYVHLPSCQKYALQQLVDLGCGRMIIG